MSIKSLFSTSTAWILFLGLSPFAAASQGASAVHFFNQADSHPVMDLVQTARSTLDIEIYQMTDPDFRAALRAAIARGVKVRAVEEPNPLGARCAPFNAPAAAESTDCGDLRGLITQVKQAGGAIVPFNKASLCGQPGGTCFEHGKMIIADHAQALVSTGNFDSTNFCNLSRAPSRCNRDFSVVTQDGEVVKTLSRVFEADLSGAAYDLKAIVTTQVELKMTVSPLSLDPLVQFIKSARQSIQIENQYLKEPTINSALIEAARAGVQVEVMTASACAFGPPKPPALAQWNRDYAAFDAAGVKTRIFNASMKVDGVPGYLHAKAIVVDHSRAWVGSVNGSSMATSNNREFGLFFEDAVSVQALSKILSQDFGNTSSESWQESAACTKEGSAGASTSQTGA